MTHYRKNCKPRISKSDIQLSVNSCTSWAELARVLKGNDSDGNVRTLKRYVSYYEIDVSHFNQPKPLDTSTLKYSHDEMFTENSPVSNTVLVKSYRRYYPPVKCAECGTGTTWNGKPLTLHIDHIDGCGTDWRLSNLRYLCPNCHYQTDTHGTKRGVTRKKCGELKATPTELSESFDEHNCYKTVGLIFGISDRTVKNIIRKYRRFTPS